PEGEQERTPRGLRTDALEAREVGERLVRLHALQEREVERPALLADRGEQRLDARGLHARESARADRVLDGFGRRRVGRLPRREAALQLGEDLARRRRRVLLRQDREHELV